MEAHADRIGNTGWETCVTFEGKTFKKSIDIQVRNSVSQAQVPK
jgi:hypothetical protein